MSGPGLGSGLPTTASNSPRRSSSSPQTIAQNSSSTSVTRSLRAPIGISTAGLPSGVDGLALLRGLVGRRRLTARRAARAIAPLRVARDDALLGPTAADGDLAAAVREHGAEIAAEVLAIEFAEQSGPLPEADALRDDDLGLTYTLDKR